MKINIRSTHIARFDTTTAAYNNIRKWHNFILAHLTIIDAVCVASYIFNKAKISPQLR